ncbi:MAG TPA: ion channel [Bryobacteraceae bacterium]|nr:ion channel [Bryobacteraceae bacterium]
MHKVGFDPGLTQQFTSPFRRVINKDGSFNVHRRGTTWRDVHPYLHLINMGWCRFLASLFVCYVVINTLFAAVYFALGTDQLQGGDSSTPFERFMSGFFFSAHTLTTVGYGNISPKGLSANLVSSFESLVGVLAFAVATGLLYGRVSRPSARIGFSDSMVVSPYQEGTSLQFRVVNRRPNSLMELEVRPMLMTVETADGEPKRTYQMLKLERDGVLFLPLTWTVVHPIDSESPLWGKTAEDLARLQAEVLILVKAYDDTFSQTVAARYSYRHDEILWGRRFAPAFFVDGEGDLVLEIRKVGELAEAAAK